MSGVSAINLKSNDSSYSYNIFAYLDNNYPLAYMIKYFDNGNTPPLRNKQSIERVNIVIVIISI